MQPKVYLNKVQGMPQNSRQVHTPIEGHNLRVLSDLVTVDAVNALTPQIGSLEYKDCEYIKRALDSTYDNYVLRGFVQHDNEYARAVFSPRSDHSSVAVLAYKEEVKEVGELKWPALYQTFLLPKTLWDGIPESDVPVVSNPYKGRNWKRIKGEMIELDDPALKPLFFIYEVTYYDSTVPYNEYEYDKETGTTEQKTHSIVDGDGPPGAADQVFLGNNLSLKITRTGADLSDIYRTIFGTVNMNSDQLPPELISISIEWSEGSGEGSYATDWSGNASGNPRQLSGGEQGSAESSASLIPDVTPRTRRYSGSRLPCTYHTFYMPNGSTQSDILNRITGTPSMWPVMKPESVVISLKGGKVSISARASAQASLYVRAADPPDDPGSTSSDITVGSGDAFDVARTHATKTIDETLHTGFSLSGDASRSVNISASSEAVWASYGGFPAANVVKNVSYELLASVSPTSVPATSPSAIPKSGLYVVDLQSRPYDKDNFLVIAAVINANIFS